MVDGEGADEGDEGNDGDDDDGAETKRSCSSWGLGAGLRPRA